MYPSYYIHHGVKGNKQCKMTISCFKGCCVCVCVGGGGGGGGGRGWGEPGVLTVACIMTFKYFEK